MCTSARSWPLPAASKASILLDNTHVLLIYVMYVIYIYVMYAEVPEIAPGLVFNAMMKMLFYLILLMNRPICVVMYFVRMNSPRHIAVAFAAFLVFIKTISHLLRELNWRS